MAKKEYIKGGRHEGHAQQGLQEERINPNRCVQDPAGAALHSFMQAQAAHRVEVAERQAAAQAARKAARKAGGAEEAGRTAAMGRAATGWRAAR